MKGPCDAARCPTRSTARAAPRAAAHRRAAAAAARWRARRRRCARTGSAACRQPLRQQRGRIRPQSRSSVRGCPARKNITARTATETAPSAAPPSFRRLNASGSRPGQAGRPAAGTRPNSSSTITVSSTRSRMIVANAAVALRPSFPREQPGPQHFAGPGRQHRARRKPDDRRAERVAEADMADRLEQVLPAHGAQQVRQRGDRHERQQHELDPRARHLAPTTSCRLALRRNSASRTRPAAQRPRSSSVHASEGMADPGSGGRAREGAPAVLGGDRPTIARLQATGSVSDGSGRHLLTCALLGGSRRVPCAAPFCTPTSHGLERFRTGKVRDVYERRRLAAHRRDRPHLGLRLRARIGHSRQGAHPHAVVGILVRPAARCRPEPRHLARFRREYPAAARAHADDARGAQHAGAAHDARCRSNAWPAATWRAPAGRSTQRTGSVCGIRVAAGPPRGGPPAGADLHAGDEGRVPATTRTSRTAEAAAYDRRRRRRRFCERVTLALYQRAAAHAESRGIILADTKFEFGWTGEPARSDADSDRRGPHAGFVALLARRTGTARRCPAELRQAVRARLPRADPLEQAAAGSGAARRCGDGAPARSTSRPSRLTGHALDFA